jgi:hypothetical protein
MRHVYSHQDHARVGFYKSILDDAGIATFMKNDVSSNSTDIPSLIIAPTLCVVNDEDYERAREILNAAAFPATEAAVDWKCVHCGEEVPGNFDTCWNCGAGRDGKLPEGGAEDA